MMLHYLYYISKGRLLAMESRNIYQISKIKLETPSAAAFIEGNTEKTVYECTSEYSGIFSLSVPCRVTAFARYVIKSGFLMRYQDIDTYDLIFVIDGKLKITNSTDTYTAVPGDAVFVRTSDRNTIAQYDENPIEIIVLRSSGYLSKSFYELTEGKTGHTVTFSNPPKILALFDKIFYYMEYTTNLNNVLIANTMSELLTELYINYINKNSGDPRDEFYSHPKWFTDTINYIEKNYASCVNIKEIADKMFINKSKFFKIFKEYTGLTPYQYITKVRMTHARQLLCDTDLQIKTIAITVGYNSTNHFISHFKEYYQITPSEYKKSAPSRRLIKN